ncbi:MAG: beta family protein [Pseudomonadota bacterium]
MNLSKDTYVPALRWRLGEFQALFRLAPAVKDRVMPLLFIPPVEYDFDEQRPKKTVHEHVHPFVTKFEKKWGKRPAWIALDPKVTTGRMSDGSHPFDYILDGLRPKGGIAIPAMPLNVDSDTMDAAARATEADGQGAAVILRLEDMMSGNPHRAIVNFANSLDIELSELDVIIDLGAPNFEPYKAFAGALTVALKRLGNLNEARHLVLIGTAIPDSFSQLAKGSDEIPRHDWLFYKELIGGMPSGMRRPIFGDHTTVHPDFVALDMRFVKPAGKITYTGPTSYGTRKGKAFRGNEGQMREHCEAIIKEARFAFRGASFSLGDKYIADCASHVEGTGSPTTWKWVAINHHITTVADDLATLFGTP